MLNVVSSLKGFELQAQDGSLGTVSDFLFDDDSWIVRWMLVDTGHWLTGRKILIHPSAIVATEYGARKLTVALSMAQVRDSPNFLQDRPVSQQMQNDLYSYYGWDPLWGCGVFGAGLYGGAMLGGGFGTSAARTAERSRVSPNAGDHHLRSIAEVTGYRVLATDGMIGHIEDILIESKDWGVRYLIVDTSNWWVGQHVLISPAAVKRLDWPDHRVELDVTRDKVRSSPSWNPADTVSGEFERQLHRHYDWPGYQGEGAAPLIDAATLRHAAR